jgi:hypothetical protein
MILSCEGAGPFVRSIPRDRPISELLDPQALVPPPELVLRIKDHSIL